MGAPTHPGEKHHTPGGQNATLDAHTSTFQTGLKKLSLYAIQCADTNPLHHPMHSIRNRSDRWQDVAQPLPRLFFSARTLHSMLLEGINHLFNQRFGLSSLYALQALLEHSYPLPQLF